MSLSRLDDVLTSKFWPSMAFMMFGRNFWLHRASHRSRGLRSLYSANRQAECNDFYQCWCR